MLLDAPERSIQRQLRHVERLDSLDLRNRHAGIKPRGNHNWKREENLPASRLPDWIGRLKKRLCRSPDDICRLENGFRRSENDRCRLPDDRVLLTFDHVRLLDGVCRSDYRVCHRQNGLKRTIFRDLATDEHGLLH